MRLGAYEVVSELGRGGMGTVLRARSPEGRDVAIKVLNRLDVPTRARFERERRLLGSLGEEDGFVPLLDAGSSAEGPFIVMPLLGGGTLRDRLERGPLTAKEALELGRRLGEALGRAHARGIVHRDMKPENVLFTAEGRALVADLGLAKHFDRQAPGASQTVSLTRSNEIRGTAGYMAPEQVGDAREVGPAADVFALGAIVWECLAGKPAFEARTVLEILALAATGSARLGPLGRSDVPRGVEDVLRTALAARPAARFRDGASFARALAKPTNRGARRALGAAALAVAAALVAIAGVAHIRAATRGAEARALVDEARRAQDRADPRAALAAIDRAIVLEPASAELLAFRAEQRACDAGFKGERSDADCARERADALADADRALTLDPRAGLAWAARGVVLEARGDLHGALEDLDRAAALVPDEPTVFGDRASARQAAGDLAGALDDVDRAVALAPRSALNLGCRAGLRHRRGDLDGARADIDRAIELAPACGASWWFRANLRFEKTDLDGALRDITRALDLEPRAATYWSLRARIRFKRNDPEGAIADGTKAIELDPALPEPWEIRGAARAARDDYASAHADLTRAVSIAPRFASAWANRAAASLQLKDRDAAIADASRAIELAPNLAWAWSVRAQALEEKQDRPGAAADATRALELDPTLVEAWATRAYVRARTGELDGAIADASRAIELDPRQVRGWGARAVAREKRGDVEGAIRDYRRFMELAPPDSLDPVIRERLAALEARVKR